MLQFLLAISDEANHGSVTDLYYKYNDYMLKFAVSKFKNMGRPNCVYDAEDVVQNAFVKITKYINRIDFSAGEISVKNYVFTILNNEICNLVRENVMFEELDESLVEEAEYNLAEELEVRERYNEVVKAIEGLDEKYSTSLFLLYCKEMTVDEIADMMGISPKTVYTRIARGKNLLISILKGAEAYE